MFSPRAVYPVMINRPANSTALEGHRIISPTIKCTLLTLFSFGSISVGGYVLDNDLLYLAISVLRELNKNLAF